MSEARFAVVPSGFENATASLIAASGLAARVLVDQFPSAAAAGNLPAFFGGCSVIDITAVSTDTVSKDVLLYHGIALTTVGASTGTATSTTSTLVRASGSYITDGWELGDLVMAFAPKSEALNPADGLLGIVTSLAALTLGVNGTPLAAGTLVAGTRICRMSLDVRASVPLGSGTNGSAPSVGLLNHGNDGSLLRYERKLGANELMAVAVATAVSALPAYINVSAQVARY
jgi:hypothetical protein